jgi:membrane-associated phospholipid phosphatase
MPHFASYPITLDQLMFLGQVPTAWLQKHLYDPANVRPYEIVFAVTYVSYFFVPHIMAIASWRLRPSLFPRVPVAILVTFHVGLLFYFLLPTVPPWLAHEFGRGPEMARVMLTLTSQVDPNGYENAARAVGANDVGAMPSLHMALTVLTALVAAEFGRFWKYVGWLYAFMMGLSLVYLGEHYVIDEVAGVALALGAWKFSAWALRHWQFEQIPVAHPQPLAVGAPLGAEPPAPERVA